jgi:alpha,alpha-trehalase
MFYLVNVLIVLGWAPLQMVSWKGLVDYGYEDIARCLAYRWLYMLTKSFVDHNGVVPEKFDAVNLDHNVHVEYGNVGTDFKMIPREGFGWMNASYKVGLSYLNHYMTRALGALVDPDQLMKKIKEKEDAKGGRLSSDYTSSSDTEAELLA